LTGRGFIKPEVGLALEAATEQYGDNFFIIIVNLDKSNTPDRLSSYHSVYLYEDSGFEKLLSALQERAKKLGLRL
jgi:hypothetical protein